MEFKLLRPNNRETKTWAVEAAWLAGGQGRGSGGVYFEFFDFFLIFLNYSEGFLRLCQLGDAKPKENLRKTKTPASPRPTWEQPQPHQIHLGSAQSCPGLSAGLQTAWEQPQPPSSIC